jgi:hypothetical protein
MRCWYWLGLSVFLVAGPAKAAVVDLLIPAYANPCCDDGPAMWSNLESAAASPNFKVNVIFNPASGPGTSVDPNYLSNGQGPLVDVRAAGATVYGYVATTYGDKSLGTVKAEIDKYFDTLYAGHVDSIFFDEMSNDLVKVGYYQELRDYVRSKNAGAKVIGNPGTPFTFSSGTTAFTPADYAASMDVLVIFENTGSQYLNNYFAPSWGGNLPADHFGHLVHSQGTWNDDLIALAASRNAGLVYITDDDLSVSNPWDRLPTYWDPQLTAIATHNLAAIPEPSSLALLSAGVLGLIGYGRHAMRRQQLTGAG